jgi:uncharacterized protein YciI
MNFVVIGMDPPGGEPRARHRAAHLEYVEGVQGSIVYGGPLIEDGLMIGSIIVYDVPDRAALDAIMDKDPYFNPGIFETVRIYESRWMVPERESGCLRAEAARARSG